MSAPDSRPPLEPFVSDERLELLSDKEQRAIYERELARLREEVERLKGSIEQASKLFPLPHKEPSDEPK
jgi:hypothetical protein